MKRWNGNPKADRPKTRKILQVQIRRQKWRASVIEKPPGKPLVPHGMSTCLGAPAAFTFTASAIPERHLRVAEWMGVTTSARDADSAGAALREAFTRFMQTVGMPNGLRAVGYDATDIRALAEGTVKQKRLLDLAPKPVHRENLEEILENSLTIW